LLTGSEYDEQGGQNALTRPSFTVVETPDSLPPETGRARYLRYLLRRLVERPQLLLDGARAVVSPHIAYIDLAGGPSRSVIIFSSHRSGSTLLSEVLAQHDRQRLIFEPLRSDAVGVSRNIPRCRYVDPASDDPEVDRIFKKILSGRIRNLWVDKENTSRLPRGRVIKDCYGTNLAPYLATHFPEVPLIFLLRHPVATAHSAVALGWFDELEIILDQHDLTSQQFAAQTSLIEAVAASERNTVTRYVLRWCLENSIPIDLLSRQSTHVVFYEDLVRSGEAELDRLAEFLCRRSPALWSGWHPDSALLARPSATGTAWRDDDRQPSQEQRRNGWQSGVSAVELGQSMEILGAFGLDRLYGPGPDPLVAADQVLTRP